MPSCYLCAEVGERELQTNQGVTLHCVEERKESDEAVRVVDLCRQTRIRAKSKDDKVSVSFVFVGMVETQVRLAKSVLLCQADFHPSGSAAYSVERGLPYDVKGRMPM